MCSSFSGGWQSACAQWFCAGCSACCGDVECTTITTTTTMTANGGITVDFRGLGHCVSTSGAWFKTTNDYLCPQDSGRPSVGGLGYAMGAALTANPMSNTYPGLACCRDKALQCSDASGFMYLWQSNKYACGLVFLNHGSRYGKRASCPELDTTGWGFYGATATGTLPIVTDTSSASHTDGGTLTPYALPPLDQPPPPPPQPTPPAPQPRTAITVDRKLLMISPPKAQ